MNTLIPTRGKLLVTPYRREKRWGGSIMLNETARNILTGDDHCFWVVAVSDGVEDVRVKDRVILIQDHDGLEYLTDGTKRAFIKLDQILLVLPHEGFVEGDNPPCA
jgi:hypothetical protein